MINSNNQIIVYNNGEIELEVSLDKDSIWLSQSQISELFETSTDNVSLHLKNIYKEKELDENLTTEDFSVVRQEGKRKVKRTLNHYSLDAVISVGYRVSSYRATKFRQWATGILKEYILSSYAINTHKITEQRLINLENDMGFDMGINKMITTIDYGMCNLGSIQNMFKYIGVESQIESVVDKIKNASKILLPGVGSFKSLLTNSSDEGTIDGLGWIDKSILTQDFENFSRI